MGRAFTMSILKGLMHLSISRRKICWTTLEGNLCCLCKYCNNEKKYCTDDVLRSHMIKHGFMEDYHCWDKYGEEGLNNVEMRDSYLKREVPTGVEEDTTM
jgi:hypothetical protein